MRGALLPGWLWLLPAVLAAGGPPAPRAADMLFLRYKNDAPFGQCFAYRLDSYARAGTAARAAALWAAGRARPQPAGQDVLQAGFTQDRLWPRATVVNTLPQRARFVWRCAKASPPAPLPGGSRWPNSP